MEKKKKSSIKENCCQLAEYISHEVMGPDAMILVF